MKIENFIYFSYSYSFNKNNTFLYLYWPYEWDQLLEAECLLLNAKYSPKPVHRLAIIQFNPKTCS